MAGKRALAVVVAGICMLLWTVTAVYADWGLNLLTDPNQQSSTQSSFASIEGCTDGRDTEAMRVPDYSQPLAYVLIRQEQNTGGWNSLSGWYSQDLRGEIPLGSSKTFADFYVWANPGYAQKNIDLSYYWYTGQEDPSNWVFTLQMLSKPAGVVYSGATSWVIPASAIKTTPQAIATLPAFITTDGLEGYRFRLTAAHVVPEPTASMHLLGGLTVVAAAVRRRR